MSPHELALIRLWELAMLLGEDTQRGLATHGLTKSRAQVLWELNRRGPVPQRVLADVLEVSARNVTGLVDALVATGFVTREPHPSDRRATLVTLTRHGIRTVEAWDLAQREFADALFTPMAAEEFTSFVEGLNTVLGRVREMNAPSPNAAERA